MISWRFVFQKLIHLILVFIGVSIVTFCISHVIPGDPARMLVGPHASPETLEAARQSLGLDKPVLTQYVLYMEGLFHGDMGVSIRTQMPVAGELARYFPATLELTLAAMVIAVFFGIFPGSAVGGASELLDRPYLPGDFHGGRIYSPLLVRRGVPHSFLQSISPFPRFRQAGHLSDAAACGDGTLCD